MNQDQTKEFLEKIIQPKKPFTLAFTGKSSKKCHGIYQVNSAEIIINNKNFDSDNMLMHTAMHEFAHHIEYERNGKSSRHGNSFRSILSEIINEAILKGLYCPDYSPVADEIAELKTLLNQHAKLEQQIGLKLAELQSKCFKKSVRIEEIADRELKITHRTMNRLMAVGQMDLFNDDDYQTADMKAAVIQAPMKAKNEVVETAEAGEPIGIVKAAAAPTKAIAPESEESPVKIKRELKRIEKTIQVLTTRKEELEEMIITQQSGDPPELF